MLPRCIMTCNTLYPCSKYWTTIGSSRFNNGRVSRFSSIPCWTSSNRLSLQSMSLPLLPLWPFSIPSSLKVVVPELHSGKKNLKGNIKESKAFMCAGQIQQPGNWAMYA